MTIGSCPRCRDEVTIPAGAAADAKVRCPLCQEEYELSEALNRLPPELILVEAAAGSDDQVPSFGDFAAIAAGAAAQGDEESGGFQFADDDSVKSSGAKSSSATPSFTATPRPQRKQKNALWEVGKIAGGGILGLAIGQLLLWWLPLPPGKGDPFQLGPKVAQYLPWIVPAAYSGGASGDDASGDAFNASGNRFADAFDQAKRDSSQRQNTGRRRNANQAAQQAAPKEPAVDGQSGDNEYEVLTHTPQSAEKFSEPLVPDAPVVDLDLETLNSGADPAPESSEAPTPEPQIGGVRGAPQISAVHMLEAIQVAMESARSLGKAQEAAPAELTEDDRAALLRRSAMLYQSLASVAEAATFLDPADDGGLAAVESLRVYLRDFADDQQTLQSLSGLAPTWINRSNRASSGVVLIGEVAEMRAAGRLFETTIKMLPSDGESEPVEAVVVSAQNPQDSYEVGDRLVMLGAIVENPAENLAGYRGKSAQVVLGGLPVNLAK